LADYILIHTTDLMLKFLEF